MDIQTDLTHAIERKKRKQERKKERKKENKKERDIPVHMKKKQNNII